MREGGTWTALISISEGLARAASRAVVVVPMLEPKKRGYARSRLITRTPGGARGHHGPLTPCPLGQVPPVVLTHERHDGCSEDAAALEREGQAGPHEDGQIAAEPAEWGGEVCGGGAGHPQSGLLAATLTASPRPTSVDDGAHGLAHAAPQSGAEQLDDEGEAGTEHEQGGSQQDEAHGQVRERCALEQVAAWWRGRGG